MDKEDFEKRLEAYLERADGYNEENLKLDPIELELKNIVANAEIEAGIGFISEEHKDRIRRLIKGEITAKQGMLEILQSHNIDLKLVDWSKYDI